MRANIFGTGTLRREIRCYLRANVNEHIRWYQDVDLSVMPVLFLSRDIPGRRWMLGVGSSVLSHHGARKSGAHALHRARLDVPVAFFRSSVRVGAIDTASDFRSHAWRSILALEFIVRYFQPFAAGLHHLRNLSVYVSRGTGYWGPPNRFGVPSEITRIRLVSDSSCT